MSLVLPVFYHWSPEASRKAIVRDGLRPTCPTEVHGESQKAVCLGTSPSHAWSLCGALRATQGDVWDLWQVSLDEDDWTIPLPFFGYRLEEVRVANRIPKGRVWHVGERTVGARRWSHA
jgi:hypothetical protein